MASIYNTHIAALFLSLTIVVAALSPASAYGSTATTLAPPPDSGITGQFPTPAPSFEGPYSYDMIPIDEQEMGSRYLMAAMTAAVKKVELFVANELEKKLKEAELDEYEEKMECLVSCKEMYENAAESMKQGVESVNSGDFIKAAFDVSAFNSDVDTCNECSNAFNEFDEWAKAVAGRCLEKIVEQTSPF